MKHSKLVGHLLDWFAHNARDLPWRRTGDPYAIWVSEIMLQQTQVKTVLPYWERWMKAIPDIRSLAKAKPQVLHKLWEGLGYYTRVRNMHKASELIVTAHEGCFPTDFGQVLALPGIGRYTAGAICSIAFGQPQPILDGNVIRVLTRLFGISGKPREKETNTRLWGLAEQLIQTAADYTSKAKNPGIKSRNARSNCSAFNQALMELGSLVCTPREPRCKLCPVARNCIARRQNRVGQLPTLVPRVATTRRKFVAFVAEKGDKFLVRQRPAGVVNAHFWEFPNIEITSPDTNLEQVACSVLGRKPDALKPLCRFQHTITRYRITMEAVRASANGKSFPNVPGRWLRLDELERLPFSSAHKKILNQLGRTPPAAPR